MTTSPEVAEVFASAKFGPDCWRTKPQAAVVEGYLSAVEEYMATTGQNPTWTRLADKLTELGADISPDRLRHHYNRRCRCYKAKTK